MENNKTLPPKSTKIWQFLDEIKNKKGVTEIVINNPSSILAEKDGRFFQLDLNVSPADIKDFINDVCLFNRLPCDNDNPILDGILPNGERINIVHPPIVFNSPAITIRPFDRTVKRFDDFPGVFHLDNKWIQFIKALVIGKANIIISGGTGVGKTTFLNLLLNEVPLSQRIVTIEDTRELHAPHNNIVNLEVKNKVGLSISAKELVKNSLRMRPDRIIIGEIRGPEMYDLLQAMNTGHQGSFSSIHSNSPIECLTRMNTLYMLSGVDIPSKTVKIQISSAINFIIQLVRVNNERYVSEILEITGIEGENITTQKIATLKNRELTFLGIAPKNMDILTRGGLSIDYFQ